MFARIGGSIAIMVCLCSVGVAGDLMPRHELAKSAVVSQPDYAHQLVVKLRDALRVRCSGDGVVSLSSGDLSEIETIAGRHQATFSPLINLPQQKLDFLEQRAARISGISQPDLAGMMVVHAPAECLQDVADELNASPTTEFVCFQQLIPAPPCEDIAPTTPDYFSLQTYHGPDPGLNMTAAWAAGSARGAGLKVADCEYGYVDSHEDLCDITMEPGQTIHPSVVQYGWDEHGTAVFGEMIGLDNEYGCTGLAPEAAGYFFTEWSVEEDHRRVTCIANAIATVDPGDIVVLEMQTVLYGYSYGPAELDPAVWTLVKNASDSNIIVVAAAGNGDQNLDSATYQEYMERGDSGAIIVGAGSPDTAHDKLSYSTYGSRVNVQGWGWSVFTLGYGDYAQHGGDKNQRYTAEFSGTSSATPFVASCTLALQSLAEERLGRRLGPFELRELLVSTGIPQGSGGHIGPFPDMAAAAAAIPLAGDLDGDGCVDQADLGILLADWGCTGGNCPGDCDDDGDTDQADLGVLLAQWGTGCP
jgi:hypothetical protein